MMMFSLEYKEETNEEDGYEATVWVSPDLSRYRTFIYIYPAGS